MLYVQLTLAKDRTATLETEGATTAALEEYDIADRAAIRAAEENMLCWRVLMVVPYLIIKCGLWFSARENLICKKPTA